VRTIEKNWAKRLIGISMNSSDEITILMWWQLQYPRMSLCKYVTTHIGHNVSLFARLICYILPQEVFHSQAKNESLTDTNQAVYFFKKA